MGNEIGMIKEPSAIHDGNQEFWMRFFKLEFDFAKSQYSNGLNFLETLKRITQIKIPRNANYELQQCSLERVLNDTKELQPELFNGVDLEVPSFIYEFDENENKGLVEMYERIDKLAEKDLINEEQYMQYVIDYFVKNTTKKNVYDIPVEQGKTDSNSGLLEGKVLQGPCLISAPSLDGIIKLLKVVGALDERIFVGERLNALTVGGYIHEIIHCLIDRNKGIVENYFHDEFLPIFMEKVAIDFKDQSGNKRNLKIAEIMRLKDMQVSLIDLVSRQSLVEERYESIKYIQSGILAGLLFDKYEKANKEGKERILSEVRDVLNGKEKVQSIIDTEKLSIEDSKEYFDKIEGYIQELEAEREFLDKKEER